MPYGDKAKKILKDIDRLDNEIATAHREAVAAIAEARNLEQERDSWRQKETI